MGSDLKAYEPLLKNITMFKVDVLTHENKTQIQGKKYNSKFTFIKQTIPERCKCLTADYAFIIK